MALPLRHLKPEDSAPEPCRPLYALPADPELALIELLDMARPLIGLSLDLRDQFTKRADATEIIRKARPRSVELAEDVSRLVDALEALPRTIRAHRAAYVDLGVR